MQASEASYVSRHAHAIETLRPRQQSLYASMAALHFSLATIASLCASSGRVFRYVLSRYVLTSSAQCGKELTHVATAMQAVQRGSTQQACAGHAAAQRAVGACSARVPLTVLRLPRDALLWRHAGCHRALLLRGSCCCLYGLLWAAAGRAQGPGGARCDAAARAAGGGPLHLRAAALGKPAAAAALKAEALMTGLRFASVPATKECAGQRRGRLKACSRQRKSGVGLEGLFNEGGPAELLFSLPLYHQ